MVKNILFSLCVIFLLIGCNQQTLLGPFVPQEEVEFSKHYLTLFQSDDFEGIENKINPALKNELLRTKLEQMAAFFPKEKPKDIKIVGSHTFTTHQFRQFNLTFQYEFPNKWLLVNIVLHKKGDELLVNAINVRPLSDSLENINPFTFQNKPIANYLILALAIIIPLFILLALVLCIKTPMPKRKWLWIIFILSSFVKITVNWTTGGINIQPLSFLLLGAGFWKVGISGPVLISVAIPLGAIIFMIKRKKWLTSRVENQD
ncbi:MAG: hypothetical protein DRR16_27145 [Candidatus Parabeggiatoa sp. nov. 3]|mgnify:CR=1 FL=1|nr:MAG: hypothetical protein DRR00_10150 [Gammaproteobacteria bacterium]RKZ68476.1 MAG: hypothetical protein DRQ99_03640 [Gammaproteobacteria bacterium]RKZ78715.1 MAG: hypothetical protein DRR16_27145 [Gammaproteobacteria bacterium]